MPTLKVKGQSYIRIYRDSWLNRPESVSLARQLSCAHKCAGVTYMIGHNVHMCLCTYMCMYMYIIFKKSSN